MPPRRTGGYIGRFGTTGGGKELKFLDTQTAAGLIDATLELAPSTAGQLVTITQGIGQSQRIGRKVLVKSIQIAGSLKFAPTTAAHAGCLTYIWLVVDKQCNGAALTAANVFDGSDAGLAVRNMEYISRFTVLKKWVWRFQPTGTNIAGTEHNEIHQLWEDYIKVNIPIEYSADTGAVGEIRHNNISLVWGTIGAGNDDTVTARMKIRVRYSDN